VLFFNLQDFTPIKKALKIQDLLLFLGWKTGFEPATSGTTNQPAELQPPFIAVAKLH